MSKPEIVPMSPPPPTRPIVIARRRTLELERDALRAGAVELALASAMGNLDARNKLAALPAKLAAVQFEIDLNYQAQELCHVEDASAEIAWRRSIQTLPAEEIIAGIGREACPSRCIRGTVGGCCITSSAPYAGPDCSHPIRARDLFHLNDHGKRLFRYSDHPAAARIFAAACRRLGVANEFE